MNRLVPTISPIYQDALVAIARILLGAILVAHGLQKFFQWGIGGTTYAFQGMGVPLPRVAAVFAASVELSCGLLLIAGAFTFIAGILVTILMLGAAIFAHGDARSLFIGDGGAELVIVIAAGALLLAAYGPGSWSVDRLLKGGAFSS